MSTEHLVIPEFFKKGCCAFFGLECNEGEGDVGIEELDPYWGVSRQMIYQGLLKAFDTQWHCYIPKLKIKSGFSSWLKYAEVLSNSKRGSEVKLLPESTNLTSVEPYSTHLRNASSAQSPSSALGLTGEMGHGKSTVALYLCQHYGYSEYSFAKPLKEGVKQLFSFSNEQVYGEEKNQIDERWGVSPRYIFQQIGTELFRNHLKMYLPQISESSDGIWIRNFFRWFALHSSRVVISDCRFMDECEALHRVGIKIYRVVRPIEQMLDPSTHAHSSEKFQKLLPVDGEIRNEGTLEQLFYNVDILLLRLNESPKISAVDVV